MLVEHNDVSVKKSKSTSKLKNIVFISKDTPHNEGLEMKLPTRLQYTRKQGYDVRLKTIPWLQMMTYLLQNT